MPLDTLRVMHRTAGQVGESGFVSGFFAAAPILVDTCQRSIWFGQQSQRPGIVDADAGLESFSGKNAYQFLLKFAAGLLSAIPGETNVFGQLKEAWRRHQAELGADLCDSNQRLMAQLFADTKCIRSKHLQHIGGHSYGTLLRHLLDPGRHECILIVGAGSLARSIAPALRKYPLAIWSRHTESWAPGHAELRFAPGDEADAARWADRIIFCTPPAREFEQTWLGALKQNPVKSVVHLGYRDTPVWWREEKGYLHLEHLFAVQRKQADIRSRQLTLAHDECQTLAANRAGESDSFIVPVARPRLGFAAL